MIDIQVLDQLTSMLFPSEELVKNEDGSYTYLKREEVKVDNKSKKVEVRLEQSSSDEKTILLASNADLDVTGLLPFLVWLGNHKYKYSYCSPTMLCFSP
jgi:hypothetical protein